MEGVAVYGHHPEYRVTFGRGGPYIVCLLESRTAIRIKHSHTLVYRMSCEIKNAIGGRRWDFAAQERKVCNMEF